MTGLSKRLRIARERPVLRGDWVAENKRISESLWARFAGFSPLAVLVWLGFIRGAGLSVDSVLGATVVAARITAAVAVLDLLVDVYVSSVMLGRPFVAMLWDRAKWGFKQIAGKVLT